MSHYRPGVGSFAHAYLPWTWRITSSGRLCPPRRIIRESNCFFYRYCDRFRSVGIFCSLIESTSCRLQFKPTFILNDLINNFHLQIVNCSLPPPHSQQTPLELNWTRTKQAELNNTTIHRKRADLHLLKALRLPSHLIPSDYLTHMLSHPHNSSLPFFERPVPPNPLAFLKWQCQKRWKPFRVRYTRNLIPMDRASVPSSRDKGAPSQIPRLVP